MNGKLFALIVWAILGGALVAAAYSPIADGEGIGALALICLVVGVIISFLGLVHDAGEK
jgi:hypothetical protein